MRKTVKILALFMVVCAPLGAKEIRTATNIDPRWQEFAYRLLDASKKLETANKNFMNLGSLDLKRALNQEAGFGLREAFGRTYLGDDNFEPATESFYIAKYFTSHDRSDAIALDLDLLDLWYKRKSDLSVKYKIGDLLKSGFMPDKRMFDEFIRNRCIGDEDYALLRSSMEKVQGITQENAYLFSRAALKFADLEAAKRYLEAVSASKLGCLKDYMLGTIAVKLKEYDRAFAYFDRCSKDVKTENSQAREASTMALARLYLEKRRYDEAVENYLKIDRSSPFYSDSLYELSYAYYKKGQFKDSLEAIDYLLLSDPTMKLFLDSMKIRGKELIPANYSESAIESYANLIMRMEYEKGKLKDAEEGYSGSENEILEFLDSSWVERPAKSIPSSLMIKSLASDDSIRRVYEIKKEISLLEGELKSYGSAIEFLRKMVREGRLMPSLDKTYKWIKARQKEVLAPTVEVFRSILDLLDAKDVAVPKIHAKTLRDIEMESKLLDTPPVTGEGPMKERESLEGTAWDLTELERKVYDLNGLLMSGWGIMDGERERLALNLKRKICEEYKDIATLKDESIVYLADIKTLNGKAERESDIKDITSLNGLLAKTISSLSLLAGFADPVFKQAGDKGYAETVRALGLASSMKYIPSSLSGLMKALKAEEGKVLRTALAQIKELEDQMRSLSQELTVLKSEFESAARPQVRLAFGRIKDMFGLYIEDYGWGLANSNFEKKKETKKKIKDLMVFREAELAKIEKDFLPVTDEQ